MVESFGTLSERTGDLANNDPSSDIALLLVEYYNKKFSMGTV